jgi:hypothetical protein
MGGGTTLVEAIALGRHAVGVDISTLADFVSTAKTMVFDGAELDRLRSWAARLRDTVHLHRSSIYFVEHAELGYYKYLDHPSRWRLRKAIEQSLAAAMKLPSDRLEAFGRCVVLRAAQRALDGRKTLPSIDEFRTMLAETALDMIGGAQQLSAAVKGHLERPTVRVINRSSAGLEDDVALLGGRAPKLVLTSPPYPGVHVLYHRWQVDGGKEIPVPFMIANKLDGSGSSYYTMGDRKYPDLKTYFDSIQATMSSVARIGDEHTVVVQMIAFSDPTWQLARYLQTMEQAGLTEMFLPILSQDHDGRLWRSVPGRRWYSDQRGATPGSRELVLFHRKKREFMQPRPPSVKGVQNHP